MAAKNTESAKRNRPRRFAEARGSDAAARDIKTGFFGMTCTRCRMLFESETEAEDHLNGPACEPQPPNDKLTHGGENL